MLKYLLSMVELNSFFFLRSTSRFLQSPRLFTPLQLWFTEERQLRHGFMQPLRGCAKYAHLSLEDQNLEGKISILIELIIYTYTYTYQWIIVDHYKWYDFCGKLDGDVGAILNDLNLHFGGAPQWPFWRIWHSITQLYMILVLYWYWRYWYLE